MREDTVRLALILILMAAVGAAFAGDRDFLDEPTYPVFTNQALSASTKVTSTETPIPVNFSSAVTLEVTVQPELVSGATLVLEPLYMIDSDGTNVGYALPLVPTDAVTLSMGTSMLVKITPPAGAYSMYLAATASGTSNVTVQGRPR
jgi:hypothetical protein